MEKLREKAVTITHRVRNDNWGVHVTESIVSGATVQDITRNQLGSMSKETIDAIDCIILVCMPNARQGQQAFDFKEMSGIGVHIIELCRQLLTHKRAAVILGGDAELWGFDEDWNAMVKHHIHYSRARPSCN